MKSRPISSVSLLLALATLSVGCSDQPTAATLTADVAAPEATIAQSDPELAALDELTRVVALALQDRGLRRRLHADLRNSRWSVEHKLPLRAYLHGQSGGILMAKMVSQSGISRDSVHALLGATRPLELYMPVDEHRERWTGDDDVILAALIQDHTQPVGYDLQGRRLFLSPEIAPPTPTLAIVPMETDFSRSLNPRHFRNARDGGGGGIGTYEPMSVEECQYMTDVPEGDMMIQSCLGGSVNPAPTPAPGYPKGVYYTGSALRGVGEAWAKGDPEIEVHPLTGFDREDALDYGTNALRQECTAGETRSGYRHFNQDSENWTGNVMVMDSAQASLFYTPTGEPRDAARVVAVAMFEDDYNPCILHTNIDMENELSYLAGFGVAMWMIFSPPAFGDPSLATKITIAAPFTYFLVRGAWWVFHTNDDYLGVATFRSTVSNPGYEGYSHIMIRDGGARNGAINLVFR